MGALEFVASLIGHVVSWPVVLLLVLLIFRLPITALLGRIREYEGMGQKVTFGDQLAEAESSVNTAVEQIEQEEAGSPRIQPDAPYPGYADPALLEQAASNPSFVTLSMWERLSAAVADLARAQLPEDDLLRFRTAGARLMKLQEGGVVNAAFVEAVLSLHELRNRVAHGQHNPTPGEAIAYAESATELSKAAQVLARLRRPGP